MASKIIIYALTLFVALLLFFIITDGIDQDKCKYHIYQYHNESADNYYTNSYTLHDGCVSFTDHRGFKQTLCGTYSIND